MTETDRTVDRNRARIGWAFVAVQGILLGIMVLLPTRDDWPTPASLVVIGGILIGLGLVGIGVAASRLGTALTPTPVPTENGAMITSGLYRFVRHPIYTGVLVIVLGLTLRSGSIITLLVAALTVMFFNLKAKWEEDQLAERYPGYAIYAAVTPRFVPRLKR